MSYYSILYYIGWMLAILAGAALGPAAAAAYAGENAGAYLSASAVAAFCGGALIIAARGVLARGYFRETLLLLIVAWPLIAIFAAIPLMLQGLTAAEAFFDALSALTTTGGWISDDIARATRSGTLWRAQLQWFGGFLSICAAVAVFARADFVGVQMPRPPFARGDDGASLRAVRRAAGLFAPLYISITLFCFAGLILTGVPAFDAACLAMSTVATGGFAPAEGGVSSYGPAGMAVIFIFMLMGSASFVAFSRFASGGRRMAAERDKETGLFLLAVFGFAMFIWLASGDEAALFQSFFEAASFLSTSAFAAQGAQTPLVAALVASVIGGAAVSTAGGFKIIRWFVVFQRTGSEIWKLIHPKGVAITEGRGRAVLGVWIYFITFTMALAALVLIIAGFGHGFDTASVVAVAAISNAGPLIALAPDGGAYGDFSTPLQLVLCGAMILGRLETAAALALVNIAFWRS
ncbi:MAG: potassium transporter TrkG [Pseudomonadota bacterium]